MTTPNPRDHRFATLILSTFLVTAAPVHAATNQWDTDSDGNWATDANWSLGIKPTNADDVVIDRAGADPTITHSSGSTTILSLNATENLTIQSSTITLTAGASAISADLTLTAGNLKTRGTATFTATGATTVTTGASFNASDGSILSLPNLNTYNDTGESFVFWEAFTASTIDLPNLTAISAGRVKLLADGAGSTIDLSSLTTFVGSASSDIRSKSGGTIILSPAGTALTDVDIKLDDTGTLTTGPIELLADARVLGPGTTLAAPLTNTAGTVKPGASAGTLNLPALHPGGRRHTAHRV